MSKLPSDIRLHIARKATKEAWKIDDLKLEIEGREISESTKSSGNNQQGSKGNNPKNSNPSTVAALVANNGKLPDNSKIQCVYCSGQHYSASCEKIVPFEARKKVLSESGRCFNCLWKGHSAKDCTNMRKCRHCQGKHHQSICPRNQKVEDPKTTEQPKDEERTTTATKICKGTVLLQTA